LVDVLMTKAVFGKSVICRSCKGKGTVKRKVYNKGMVSQICPMCEHGLADVSTLAQHQKVNKPDNKI
jgi:hypothetical protein